MLVGVGAGMIAGLLGMGGGVVVVPALIVIFEFLGFPSASLTQVALGTSLATVLVNTGSASWVHFSKRAIETKIFILMAPFVFLGSAAGSQIAHLLDGYVLQLLCGVSSILVAIKMFFKGRKKDVVDSAIFVGKAFYSLSGFLIGLLSGMLGIGGGALSVPWLTLTGVKIPRAIATASALGFTLAISGTFGYVFAGKSVSEDFAPALGYVYLPAFFGIVSTSFICARLGARLAHRVPIGLLEKGFCVLLWAIGIRFMIAGIKGLMGG